MIKHKFIIPPEVVNSAPNADWGNRSRASDTVEAGSVEIIFTDISARADMELMKKYKDKTAIEFQTALMHRMLLSVGGRKLDASKGEHISFLDHLPSGASNFIRRLWQEVYDPFGEMVMIQALASKTMIVD